MVIGFSEPGRNPAQFPTRFLRILHMYKILQDPVRSHGILHGIRNGNIPSHVL